ncbi:TetR-like C-terminal domain-containing protein [Actinomadura fibrosa]|uniref:TetR-like C-terminal domain-containing protein n=1 Tax=Actinomadura fibrosa TaxID=111802 RepID=A0ABW2XJN1_9ACTN|nr:TetR-like C-terminal domain-containing protein [Actinomadura fibrosa]
MTKEPQGTGTRETGAPGTRRRGGALEAAIYEAVFAQLETVGYRGLTMEGVAAAARTGKAALYRRWTSKDALVTDALKHVLPDSPGEPSTGSVRTDLLETLKALRDTLIACRGAAFKVLKEEAEDGKGLLHEVIRERISEPVREMMYRSLVQGAERGEVRPGAVTRRIANVGPALIVYHNLTEGGEIPDDHLASVVDEILMPIVRP